MAEKEGESYKETVVKHKWDTDLVLEDKKKKVEEVTISRTTHFQQELSPRQTEHH